MYFPTLPLVTAAFAIALASANNTDPGRPPPMGEISSQCGDAIISAFSSPDATCLNQPGLAGIAAVEPTASVVPAVDSWLTGLCALAPCTNESLANIATTIATGCVTELTSLNVTSDQFVLAVQILYPSARQIACLKDNQENVLCVTQTLLNVEDLVGPLTPDNLVPAILSIVFDTTSIPSSVICTDCIKAAYNIIQTNLPGLISQDATDDLANTCGAPFIDGQTPSTISQTAQSPTSAKFRRAFLV